MPVRFQIVIDVHDPTRELRFWASALEYVPEPPPKGFASWGDYWRDFGLAEEDCWDEPDSLIDPTGAGPRIWFHKLPDEKVVKNRLHFDLGVSGGRSVPLAVRKQRVEAEARRLVDLGATRLEAYEEPGVDHYAVGMLDPEGNEFDIN